MVESIKQILDAVTTTISIPIAIVTIFLAIRKQRLEERNVAGDTAKPKVLMLRRDPLAAPTPNRRHKWGPYIWMLLLFLLFSIFGLLYGLGSIAIVFSGSFPISRILYLALYSIASIIFLYSSWTYYRTLRILIDNRKQKITKARRRAYIVLTSDYPTTFNLCINALRRIDAFVLHAHTIKPHKQGLIVGQINDISLLAGKYFSDRILVRVEQVNDESCSIYIHSDGIRPTFRSDARRNFETVSQFLREIER